MVSNSETGHARNTSNFLSLINSCNGYGIRYRPTDERLVLSTLISQQVACVAANSALANPEAKYNQTNSERAYLYLPLGALTIRIINMFKVTKALSNTKSHAKAIADKTRGMNRQRKPKPSTTPPPGDHEYYTSQRSYIMIADNFEALIGILRVEPTYLPAEKDLQVPTLEALLANMRSYNNKTELSYKALSAVRTRRNCLFYAKGTGLVDTALDVKLYVKGTFGIKSAEYKEIKGLRFVRIGKGANG